LPLRIELAMTFTKSIPGAGGWPTMCRESAKGGVLLAGNILILLNCASVLSRNQAV
jgi:hypothetical protein